MSTNISEGLPAKKKAAPVVSAPKGGDKPDAKKGGTAENSAKRIRQAVYDIRYRARREDIDLKQAFSQYMSNTSMDQKDRAEVRAKLFGKGGGVSEQYIGASDDWALESFSKAFTKVFEHHQKDKDGNTIPHEDEFVTEYEKKLIEEKSRKYKVRVTDPKSEKSYVRYADREKITQLRGKGLKVEMTEYGTPYEGEKKRGEQTAKALGGGGKKAKKDYDGDGKVESGSKEHAGVVHNAIQRAKGGKADGKDTRKEEYLADGTTSTEPTGKKINPKGVDNYKSGAVQIAPVDEADPQNGYGVKEEVEKKDNRANYAYINFMKNKLRAGMGIKNPMIMVDPDKAKEKFEKMATSITASTGEEEEKEGACESVDQKMSDVSKAIMEKQYNAPPAMSYQKYHYGDDITDPNNKPYKDDPKKMKDFFGDKVKPNPKKNRKDIGIQSTKFDPANESIGQDLSDISKNIMERGMPSNARDLARQNRIKNQPSTNIPTESNPGGGVRNPNDPTSYPSGAEIKPEDVPSKPSTGDTPSKPSTPLKKPKPISVNSSYDPDGTPVIEGKADKRLPSGPFAGGRKDRSQARNLRKFGKKEGGDVPDKKGSHQYNPMASFEKRGHTEKLSSERRKEHEEKRGVKTKGTRKEEIDLSVQKTYDPLSNKGILEVSEKILKKNSNLGEEGYDHYKDRIAMAGGDPSSPKKKDATTLPQKKRKEVKGKTVYQKQAEKEHGKGVTALDIVKKNIEKKHGKGAIMDTKKKKDKK